MKHLLTRPLLLCSFLIPGWFAWLFNSYDPGLFQPEPESASLSPEVSGTVETGALEKRKKNGITWERPSWCIDTPRIQLALLLDVSSSMDGLIAQSNSQFWSVVDFLSKARRKGKAPVVEVALIAYGNPFFPPPHHNRIIAGLTTDADSLTAGLLSLQTGGGDEYCGAALHLALDSLSWSDEERDFRVVFIAGNESFAQGPVGYREVCARLAEKDIRLNTVYCGFEAEGRAHGWADAAQFGGGRYVNIDQNEPPSQTETPYDGKILDLYRQYRQTSLFYGPDQELHRQRLQELDGNAYRFGNAYFRQQVLFKMKKPQNRSAYDLIDAYDQDPKILERLSPNELPVELQGKSPEMIRRQVFIRSHKREVLADAIRLYAEKVEEYFEVISRSDTEEKTIGDVIRAAVREQAEAKGFRWGEEER